MNILLVSGPDISLKEPYCSGIESFMVSHANQLVRDGHSVDVVARVADDSVLFNVIDPFGISQKIRIGWLRRKLEAREFARLDMQKYDIVHYNMFYPHLYAAAVRHNKTSVVTLHTPAEARRQQTYDAFAREADVILVSISERSRQQWEAGLTSGTTLIENGIDLEAWPPKNTEAGEYLLWSARINEQKNPLAAIRLAQHSGMRLKIAGCITDMDYFKRAVQPYLNDSIEYIGHVTQSELSALAQNASAYLATATWQEPFGLASLEMLASGVPVVGFETAVPPNWKHDSLAVVGSTDWHDLVPALQKAVTIRPQECRNFAASMDIRQMTRNYTALYEELAVRGKLADVLDTYDVPVFETTGTQLLSPSQTIE